MSAAYIKLKTITGSLNWAFYEPTRMIGKQALFEFIEDTINPDDRDDRWFVERGSGAVDPKTPMPAIPIRRINPGKNLHFDRMSDLESVVNFPDLLSDL